jgi:hypothetical protein
MTAYIDHLKSGPGTLIVYGRGTEGYRIDLHKDDTGEMLGNIDVDSQGNYQLNTQEIILREFKGQTIRVRVRETIDNKNYSYWSIPKEVYIF